jgi:hypothetical protein
MEKSRDLYLALELLYTFYRRFDQRCGSMDALMKTVLR